MLCFDPTGEENRWRFLIVIQEQTWLWGFGAQAVLEMTKKNRHLQRNHLRGVSRRQEPHSISRDRDIGPQNLSHLPRSME
jgi:hypothetical protein